MKVIFILLFVLLSFVCSVNGQTYSLSGKFVDINSEEPIIGANIFLYLSPDTVIKISAVVSDVEGNFLFKDLQSGSYILKSTFIGYKSFRKVVTLNKSINLGKQAMEQSSLLLKNIEITDKIARTEQSGDTTIFNAKAYKVNKDANAEDLINKMPGITIDNGTVKSNGEEIKKVLVDGKEFYGDDASIALKNLPAELINKIQVFDRMSDQSRFTGFDDGNSQKTLNINTKSGMNNGQFGKLYAGYGIDDNRSNSGRYINGGNLNFFNGNRRISIIGLSNNINQQNFSNQDLLGINNNSNQQRGGGGQGRGGAGYGRYQSNSNSNEFFIGQQAGINTTHSYGINISDKLGERTNINGSYFFNNTINDNNGFLQRTYFLSQQINPLYSEENNSQATNFNNRLNFRIEHSIDSLNSILLSPKINFQSNKLNSLFIGDNRLLDNSLINKNKNLTNINSSGYNASNDFLYKHKFLKNGRTISFDISTVINNSLADNNLNSENISYAIDDSIASFDQRSNSLSKSLNLTPSLNYTEPIGKTGVLQFNYSTSYIKSISEKETNLKDKISKEYNLLDSILSNNYDNKLLTHKTGISFRKGAEKYNLLLGVNYQNTIITGIQNFPNNFKVQKTFYNLLPNSTINYNFSKNSNLKVVYRTNTNAPSVNQLQNVVNNSNPLQLSSGNPDLNQEYAQNIFTRFSFSNTEKARSLFMFVGAGITQNYIGKYSIIAQSNTLIDNGLALVRGTQFTKPVNLDGYKNFRSFLTYAIPLTFIKSNLNLNAGYTFNRSPGIVNEILNYSNTNNYNGGIVISSNVSEKIDFTISYTGNFNKVENSIQPQLNNFYYLQSTNFKINLMPWRALVLNTDITNSSYSGLGMVFNQNVFLCNAAIGYKFLKNNSLDIRISVYDLLNRNNSINRNVTENYIEDNQITVLNRYYMLKITYNIRKFNLGNEQKPDKSDVNYKK